MKFTKRIEVTNFDIRNGKREQVDRCPIARAVRRELKATCICIAATIDFRIKDEEFSAELPGKASVFIDRFDARMPVKPFSFYLRGESIL